MTTVDFTYSPCPIVTGCKVKFTATAAGFTPTTWTWDFGDGSTSSDQNPCHTFCCSGTYTVKLTATDGVDTAEKTHVICVVSSFWSSFVGIIIFIFIVAFIVFIIWFIFSGGKKSPASPAKRSKSVSRSRARSTRR